MAINLNVTPYYNDFNSSKKFNRVVFKPGVAVQARELTQMQDYFYETIKDMGEFLFSEGANVRDANADPVLLNYIKIDDTDPDGNTVANDTLENYIGDTLTGATTGITAKIHSVLTGTQTDSTKKKTLYVQYIKANTNLAGDGINKRFDAGETLTVTSDNSDRNGDKFLVNTQTSTTSFTDNFYGQVIDFTIQEGVIFAQGKLVKHDKQTIRLDPYSARVSYLVGVTLKETIKTSDDDATLLDPATGTYNYNAPGADRTELTTVLTKVPFGEEYQNNRHYDIGMHIENGGNIYEVTTAGTTALTGSGPDHTTGVATDGSVGFTYLKPPTNFTSVYKIKNGVLQKKLDHGISKLGEIGEILAKRTHEESGDYVVEPFTFKVIEHLKTVKGTAFDTSNNLDYGRGEFVNHSGNLYEVVVAGTSASGTPPTHTSGEALSGTVKFSYRGLSYRLDNLGYKYSTDTQDPGDADYLVAKISPGTAYVGGYRRKFIESSFVKIRKGTSTQTEESLSVPTGYGNFFDVDEVAGEWDLEEGSVVELGHYSNQPAAAVTDDTHGTHGAPSTKVATARVRQVRFISGTPGTAAAKYRIFLYDLRVNNISASSTDASLAAARTIYYSNSNNSGFADIILTDTTGNGTGDSAVLKSVNHNKMLFRCPWSATKTIYADGGNLDNNYFYTEEFTPSVNGDGQFTISTASLGSGIQLPYSSSPTQSTLDENFYVINKTNAQTIGGTSYSEGQVIRLTPSMVTAHSTQSMSFDLGTVNSAGTVYVQAKVKVVDAVPTTKNLRTGRYVKIRTNDNAGGSTGPWSLGIPDVQDIEAIYITPSSTNVYLDDDDAGVNYKDDFILDDGQRDNLYAHAKLIKKNNTSVSTTNAHITVKLKHFEPDYGSTYGTYFNVNSYPIDDTGATGIYSAEIPIYKSDRMGTFDLRDCIDFRPYVAKSANSSTTLAGATQNPYRSENLELPTNGIQFPIPNGAFQTDVEYYLPRVDRVYIDRNGNFKVQEGISEIPARPPVISPTDGMVISEIKITPFPSPAPNFAKIIKRPERAVYMTALGQHRRYTMRDIGAIEKRIDRLEYYLSLSLLEMDTKSTQILDANGLDRFKNGIYTNVFGDEAGSDLSDPSYSAGVNSIAKQLSPFVVDQSCNLIHDKTYNTSEWTTIGGKLCRPTETTFHSQNGQYITSPKNLVSDLLFTYNGKMTVYPRSDYHRDVTNQDPLRITQSNKATAEAAAAASSGNVVGYDTSFSMGAYYGSDAEYVVGGHQKDTQTIEASNADNPGSLNIDVNGSFEGGEGLFGQVFGNTGLFEQVSEGSVTGSLSGDIVTTSSFDVSTTSKALVQHTSEILSTAKVGPPSSLTFPIGNVVRDISLMSHIRPMTICLEINGLRPELGELYVFFDGEDVTFDCFAMDVDSFDAGIQTEVARGTSDFTGFALSVRKGTGALQIAQSDVQGRSRIAFQIPANRFPVGERRIFVCDDPQARDNFITSQAEGQFSAYGMHQLQQDVTMVAEIHSVITGTKPGSQLPDKHVGAVVTDVEISNFEIGTEVKDMEYDLDVTAPSYVFHPPTFVGDPLAQSFSASTGAVPESRSGGFFLNSIYVWFKERPGQKHNITNSATLPSNTGTGWRVTMSIRKMLNGYPTSTEIAKRSVYYTEVKTTPDVSFSNETAFNTTIDYATRFSFYDKPFLDAAEQYCFVLEPDQNDPNYEVWTFKLGEAALGQNDDVIVTKDNLHASDPGVGLDGVMFTSSNNRTWSPIQGQDIRYLMDMMVFEHGTGTVQFTNDDVEFVTASDYTAGRPYTEAWFNSKSYDWMSYNTTATTAGSGHAVGDVITLADKSVTYNFTDYGGASDSRTITYAGTKVEVTAVNGSGGVTGHKFIDYGLINGFDSLQILWDRYWDTDKGTLTSIMTHGPGTLTQSGTNGATTGTGTGFEVQVKAVRGHLNFNNEPGVDPDDFELNYFRGYERQAFENNDLDYLLKTTATNGCGFVQHFNFGERAVAGYYIDSINNKIYNTHRTTGTIWQASMRGTSLRYKVATTDSTGVTAAGSTFTDVIPTGRMTTDKEKAIYSLRNEAGFTGANKSAKKSYKQRIEMTSGTDVSLTKGGKNYSGYSPVINLGRNSILTSKNIINNDTTNENTNNGSALSKFISKKVVLADGQEAEDVRVSVAMKTPPGTAFKVYFKGMAQEDDADFLRDLEWTEMEYADTNKGGSSSSEKRFVDFDYQLPSTVLNSDGQFNYTVNRVVSTSITDQGGATGLGYSSLSEVDIIVDGSGLGEEASIKATALDGSDGGISAVEIINPGRGFTTAPTVTVGYDHETSKTYAAGNFVVNSGNLYKCIVGGTTGASSASSAPTHSSGNATDGGVTWEFRGTRPTITTAIDGVNYTNFKYFSVKMVMTTDNTSVVPLAKQLRIIALQA